MSSEKETLEKLCVPIEESYHTPCHFTFLITKGYKDSLKYNMNCYM